jgi:hypothetical protein
MSLGATVPARMRGCDKYAGTFPHGLQQGSRVPAVDHREPVK